MTPRSSRTWSDSTCKFPILGQIEILDISSYSIDCLKTKQNKQKQNWKKNF